MAGSPSRPPRARRAVHDLVDGVAADDATAVEAGDGAAAGVEEAEVVVDFGGGGDGGAGVAGLVFLLDGDGGGEAVHVVDVGFSMRSRNWRA